MALAPITPDDMKERIRRACTVESLDLGGKKLNQLIFDSLI